MMFSTNNKLIMMIKKNLFFETHHAKNAGIFLQLYNTNFFVLHCRLMLPNEQCTTHRCATYLMNKEDPTIDIV